jgi:thymidylate kinase
MIIEFFGPPAVGKSTLAKGLNEALRQQGWDSVLSASSRPAELAAETKNADVTLSKSFVAVISPIKRVAKITRNGGILCTAAATDPVGESLLKLMPPRTWGSRVRLQQYLGGLSRTTSKAKDNPSITIIDQGYLTALCSIAVRAGRTDWDHLPSSLAAIPKPNLLICLDASDAVLQARLAVRQTRHGIVERWFEQNANQTRQQIQMVRKLAGLLKNSDWPALFFDCSAPMCLELIVKKIVEEITARREAA